MGTWVKVAKTSKQAPVQALWEALLASCFETVKSDAVLASQPGVS